MVCHRVNASTKRPLMLYVDLGLGLRYGSDPSTELSAAVLQELQREVETLRAALTESPAPEVVDPPMGTKARLSRAQATTRCAWRSARCILLSLNKDAACSPLDKCR